MFLAQHGLCHWCGKPMELRIPGISMPADMDATFEHLKPRSAGGRGVENLVLAHYRCNMARGNSHGAPPVHLIP
jgi:5-methylcytosine-specific restriction endonuclease McrA